MTLHIEGMYSMFCSVKKVKSDSINRYRFYLCERVRVAGKVKSIDKLVITLDEWDVTEVKPSIARKVIETTMRDKDIYNEDHLNMIYEKYLKLHKELMVEYEKRRKEEEEAIRNEQREKAEEQSRINEEYRQYQEYKEFKSSGISLDGIDNTTKEMMLRIIKEGYRKLSHRFHPDKGGRMQDMQMLNDAKESLDKILGV